MTKLWIDTDSGTWGEIEHIRIVDPRTVFDDETPDEMSLWAALDSMTDSERNEFGVKYGHRATEEIK